MPTRYLKSANGKTVVRVSNKETVPQISEWYSDHGYTQIDEDEFKRLRAKIRRMATVRHGYTTDEKELQRNLTHKNA